MHNIIAGEDMIEIIATLCSVIAGLSSIIIVLRSFKSKKENSINITTSAVFSPGKMTGKYIITNGQVGVMGNNAKVDGGIHFNTDMENTVNLESLAVELNKLRELMKVESKDAEQDAIIGVVAKAEMSAMKGNQKETISVLKEAGKWSFALAQRLGLNVAMKAIKLAIAYEDTLPNK